MTIKATFSKIKDALDPFWIIFAAFLLTFYWFFIRMVFFDPSRVMKVFDTVRRIDPIGYDLVQMLNYPSSWLLKGTTPYVGGNLYPPLATVLFAPLINIDIRTAYFLVTNITLLCFFGIAFLFPLLVGKSRKPTALLMLLFLTGLTSYGFQFELERGQFNMIAMALCFLAIYLFHRKPKLSWLAYILFTLSIQLKLFPAIFVFFFIRDWKDIRGNLIRLAGLGLANIALLFILGWGVFQDFLGALQWKANDPGLWVGNLSIRSFAQRWLQKTVLPYLGIPFAALTSGRKEGVEILLYLLVFALVLIALVKTIRKGKPGIDPALLFICTCAALLIPPVSHDFKLPLLVGPTACFFLTLNFKDEKKTGKWLLQVGLVFIFAMTYFSTQYSFLQKSPLIQNNFPAVLGLMILVVILMFLLPKEVEPQAGENNS